MADKYIRNSTKIPSNAKVISFTFDDVPESAFNNAQAILDKNQLQATFYIVLSFLDSNLYNRQQLSSCISNGHELGCHTYGHIHFYQVSNTSIIKSEIRKNQTELNKIGIEESFVNFSYPFGEQTIKAKKIVANHFETCRGTNYGINKGKIDMDNLKAVKLYEKLHSLDTIFSILEEFNKSGGWLIFYTHDVQTDFSQYGCSPEYFEKIILRCKDLNIDIQTVRDAAKKLGITKHKGH